MTTYRADLPQLPARWERLPLNEKGYPVPWFVAFIDGKPDFRVIRPGGIGQAYNSNTCWLCGHRLGMYKACVVGPMCGVNRVTSEPASHYECANYAVRACPFLTRPMAVRRERGLPEERHVAGEGIQRNPGVSLIWISRTIKPFKVHNGVLFRLQDPTRLEFWREGRMATRAEVDEAVSSGLPLLQAAATRDGEEGMAELMRQADRFTKILDEVLPQAA